MSFGGYSSAKERRVSYPMIGPVASHKTEESVKAIRARLLGVGVEGTCRRENRPISEGIIDERNRLRRIEKGGKR